ncbi:MAG: ATP-binding cassette domain-containing protein, partial [Thermoleophilaceae bacterium]
MLHDLSAEIEPGATALLGPSGSGKSTLLRLLNRLADPDEGVVRMDGDDVRGLDVLELRRRAVLVPQLPAPLPGTVAANVAFGPSLVGREVDATRMLELAGLDGSYADREASRLSVGEQQRVMLARALALDPEVLLLDEPTSALDESARDEIERTLGELRDPAEGPEARRDPGEREEEEETDAGEERAELHARAGGHRAAELLDPTRDPEAET